MKTNFSVVKLLLVPSLLVLGLAQSAFGQSPANTNRPPYIEITTPANGAVFTAPATVTVAAQAFDGESFVATVEFFEGAHSLGIATNNPLVMSPMNPFLIAWKNVAAGQYTLTAKATDNGGATAWSPPVRVYVVSPSNSTQQAVVNIYALDDQGSEIPVVPPGMGMPQRFDPAVFRVTRTGGTNIPLTVFYHVGGTARNEVDYDLLPGRLDIPAGALAADLTVVVLDDFLVEGTESVVITVDPPVCAQVFPPPPGCYLVGQNGSATAWILDNDTTPPPPTNLPPTVRITAPAEGTTFPAPAEIHITAVTVDPDGYAATAEFFANNLKIGESSIVFIQEPPPGQPIQLDFQWRNVPVGNYSLTARTVDNRGASALSAPVRVTVGATNLPPTNTTIFVNIVARDPFASEGTNFFGTNNPAVFVVRRTGGTNADLAVPYTIGGTASNGLDYMRITNSVTIPAGRHSARITINPIDDTEREKVETVVLKLVPPSIAANPSGAGWMVGFPGHAAATIADNDHAIPPCLRLPDQLFHLCLPRTNGFCFRLEASTNMIHWTPVCTNVVVDGALRFVDPDAPQHPRRFYRETPVPPLPAED